jgi:xanthine dehydrogenase accessory factor
MVANKMMRKELKNLDILIRGGGEMATGVAVRLYRANFKRILMLETSSPLAVRRRVSFCEAIHDVGMSLEEIEAVRVSGEDEIQTAWDAGRIAVRVDPSAASLESFRPDVLIDAILAKRNLGTAITDAPLVIALGPGFTAGVDCHLAVETNRGHDLGRLISYGSAEANTGIPGNISGHTRERVLRSPVDGIFITDRQIGDLIRQGDLIGQVAGNNVSAGIDGVLRGLIRPGSQVTTGLKIGDIDPRGEVGYCDTISEKARSLGGAVLEAILSVYNR